MMDLLSSSASDAAYPGPHLSYVRGEQSAALMEATLGDYFDAAVAAHADRDALIVPHQGIRWTYRQLQTNVNALACGLLRLGLQRGDRVGIWAQNCAEWVLTQFATAQAGLILVNINPAYRTIELQYCLQKVGVRALILAPRCKTSDYIAQSPQPPQQRLFCRRGDAAHSGGSIVHSGAALPLFWHGHGQPRVPDPWIRNGSAR